MATTSTFRSRPECIDPYAMKRYLMFQNRGQHHYPGYPIQNFTRPPRPRPLMEKPYFPPYRPVNFADRRINKPYRRRSHLNDIYGVNTEDGRFSKSGKRPFCRNNPPFWKDVTTDETDIYAENNHNGSYETKQIKINLNEQNSTTSENRSPNKTELICESLDINENANSPTQKSNTPHHEHHELVTETVINLCSPEPVEEIQNEIVTITATVSEEEEPKKCPIPFLENSDSFDAQSTVISDISPNKLTVVDELTSDRENKILENMEHNKDLNGNPTHATESYNTIPSTQSINKNMNVPVQDVDTPKKNSCHESDQRLRRLFGDEDVDEKSTSFKCLSSQSERKKMKKSRYSSAVELHEKNKSNINKTYKIPRLKKETTLENNFKNKKSSTFEVKVIRHLKKIRRSIDNSKHSSVDSQPLQSETRVCKDMENGTKQVTHEYKTQKSYSGLQIEELKKNVQHELGASENKIDVQISKKSKHRENDEKKPRHKSSKLKRSHSSVQTSESSKNDSKNVDKDSKEKVPSKKLKTVESRGSQKEDYVHKIKKARLEVRIQKLDSEIVKRYEKGKKIKISDGKLSTVNSEESKRFCKDVANGVKQKNDESKLKKLHSEIRIEGSVKRTTKIVEKDMKQKSAETDLNGSQSNGKEKVVCKDLENTTKQKNGESKPKTAYSNMHIPELDKKVNKDLEKSYKRIMSENETTTQCQTPKKNVSKDIFKHLQQSEKDDDYINKHRGHSKHKSSPSRKDNSELQLHSSSSTSQTANKGKHKSEFRTQKSSVNPSSQVLKHRPSTESEEEKSTKQVSSKLISNHLKEKTSNKKSAKRDSEVISKRRTSDESKSHKQESKVHLNQYKNDGPTKLTQKDSTQWPENILNNNDSQNKLSPKDDALEESKNLTNTNQNKNENQVKLMATDAGEELEYLLMSNKNDSQVQLISKNTMEQPENSFKKNDNQTKLIPIADAVEERGNLTEENQNKNESQVKLTPTDAGEELEYLLVTNKNESQIKLRSKDVMEQPGNILRNENKNEDQIRLTPKATTEKQEILLEENEIKDENQVLTPKDTTEKQDILETNENKNEKQVEQAPKNTTRDPHNLLKVLDSGKPETITLYRSDETVNNCLELQATSATILPLDTEQAEPKAENTDCEVKSRIYTETDVCRNTKGNNPPVNNTELSNDTLHTERLTLSKIIADILDGAPCTNTNSLSDMTIDAYPSIDTNVTLGVLGGTSCANATQVSNTRTNINSSIIRNSTSIPDSTPYTNVTQISNVTTKTNSSVMTNAATLLDNIHCENLTQVSIKTTNMNPSIVGNATDIVDGTSCTNAVQTSSTTANVNPSIIINPTSIPDSTSSTNVTQVSNVARTNISAITNAANIFDGTQCANTTPVSSLNITDINPSNIRNTTSNFDATSCATATQISNSTYTSTSIMDYTSGASATQLSNITLNKNHPVTKNATRNFNPTSCINASYIPNHSKTSNIFSVENMLREVSEDRPTTNQSQNSTSATTVNVSNTKADESAPVFSFFPSISGVSNMDSNERNHFIQPSSAGSLTSTTVNTSMYEPISSIKNFVFNMNTTEECSVVEPAGISPRISMSAQSMIHPTIPVGNDALRNNIVEPTRARNSNNGLVCTPIVLRNLSELMENPPKSTSNDSNSSNSLLLLMQAADIITTSVWLYLAVSCANTSYYNLLKRLGEFTSDLTHRLDAEQIAFKNYHNSRIKEASSTMAQELTKLKWVHKAYDYSEILKSVINKIQEKHSGYSAIGIKSVVDKLFSLIEEKYLNHAHLKAIFISIKNGSNRNLQVTTQGPLSPQQRDQLKDQIMCFNQSIKLYNQTCQPSIATGFPNTTRAAPNATGASSNMASNRVSPIANMGPNNVTRGPPNVAIGPTNVTRGPPNVTINPSGVTMKPVSNLTNSLSNTLHPSSLSIKQSVMNPPPYPHTAMLNNLNERNRTISNYVKGLTTSNARMCSVPRGNLVDGTQTTSSHLQNMSLPTFNSNAVVNTPHNRPIYPTQGNSFGTAVNNVNAAQTTLINPNQGISGFRSNFQTNLPVNLFQNQQAPAVPTNAAIHNTPTSTFNVDTRRISPIQSLITNNVSYAISNDTNAVHCQTVDKRKACPVLSPPTCFSMPRPSAVATTDNSNNANAVNINNHTGVTNSIPADNTDSAISQNDPDNSTGLQMFTAISTDNHIINTSSSAETREHSTTENSEDGTIEIKSEDEDDETILNQDVPEVTSVPANGEVHSHDTDTNLQKYIAMLIKSERTCVCKKPAEYVCSCKAAIYCSEECQKAEWNNHKLVCASVFSK